MGLDLVELTIELEKCFGIDVTPSARLELLIPRAARKREWHRLGEQLGWRLPDLVRPAWVAAAGCALLLSSIVAMMTAWGAALGFSLGSLVPLLTSLCVGALGLLVTIDRITSPLASGFSSDCRTVGMVTKTAVAMNFGKLSEQAKGTNQRDVWESLRQLIVDQLGVKAEDVKEDAELARDLGAD